MATKVDGHVGALIRERRVALGMTQDDLAKRLGISYQQVQKYEIGSNRVSAGRLYEIAGILNCTPGSFFETAEDLAPVVQAHGGRDRVALEIARRLPNLSADERAALLMLVKAMTGEADATLRAAA